MVARPRPSRRNTSRSVTDFLKPETRSRVMSRIRSKDTKPELTLRRALYAAGIRGWRCHPREVPGKPDSRSQGGASQSLLMDASGMVIRTTSRRESLGNTGTRKSPGRRRGTGWRTKRSRWPVGPCCVFGISRSRTASKSALMRWKPLLSSRARGPTPTPGPISADAEPGVSLFAATDLGPDFSVGPGLPLLGPPVHADPSCLVSLSSPLDDPAKFAQLAEPFLPVLLVLIGMRHHLNDVTSDLIRRECLQDLADSSVRLIMLARVADCRTVCSQRIEVVLFPTIALLTEGLQVLQLVGPAPRLRHDVIDLELDSVLGRVRPHILQRPSRKTSARTRSEMPIASLSSSALRPISWYRVFLPVPAFSMTKYRFSSAPTTVKLLLLTQVISQALPNLEHRQRFALAPYRAGKWLAPGC